MAWTVEQQRECSKSHYSRNKDRYKKATAKWRKANPEKRQQSLRRWRLKKLGLTPESAERMFKEQGGLCAICDTPILLGEHPGRGGACLDHDHLTGKARGYLCCGCNRALGFMCDSPERLRAAAWYLENTSC